MVTAGSVHEAMVRELVGEVLIGGNLDVLDRFYVPRMVPIARRWMEPFGASFADVQMRIVCLISDEVSVAARFRCSGTHLGEWRGHPPTGRRFENVDEVYSFTFQDGLIASVWGLEDTLDRFRQLGLPPS